MNGKSRAATIAVITMGLILAGSLTPAQAQVNPPAMAVTPVGHLPVAPWAANGESEVVDATTAKLQDHVNGDTSIENPSVGLNVQAGAVISVEYQLVDGATCKAGEPRLFAITNGTLDKSDLCDGNGDGATSGTLSFQTSSAGLVTQVGMVYSRDVGHVVMKNLTVDGTLVLFQEMAQPTPSPSPSVSPTATPSPSPSVSPDAEDVDCSDFQIRGDAQAVLDSDITDPHGLDEDGDGIACEDLPQEMDQKAGLPVTSGISTLPILLVSAGILLGVGAALMVLARRRRHPEH